MENMGYIFEYCDKYCKKLYNVRIDKITFLKAFMKSKLRYEMENGHQKLLSQSAIDSVEDFIKVDCKNNIDQFGTSRATRFKNMQLYWVGWMYAYLHFMENTTSSELVEIIPIEKMIECYKFGHEMDREVFYNRIKHIFEEYKDKERNQT